MFRTARFLLRSKPLIVRTDSEQQVPHLVAGLKSTGDLVELPEFGTSEQQVIEACREATLIVHCYTPITRKVMEAAPNLRGIVKYGVGIDAIDMACARDMGIPVANVPEYGEGTVAEGAFTLMICLLKKVKTIQKEMEAGGWAWPNETTLGNDLSGKTVAMLGYGRIGRKMARMCRGFDAEVVSYDPYVPRGVMARDGVEKVDSLEQLVERADVLSVHTVLNDETRGIITKQLIKGLKQDAVVVNVSRGAIVDEEALVQAVLEGRVGAGLDVFSKEPVEKGNGHLFEPLLDHPNAILTPHLAFWTAEARSRLENEALQRSMEILNGEDLTVLSKDPRLTSQMKNVSFGGLSVASGRYVHPE